MPLNVEGADYFIQYGDFKPGYSFFIPCLDIEKAKTTIEAELKEKDKQGSMLAVIEDGIKGLRVWAT